MGNTRQKRRFPDVKYLRGTPSPGLFLTIAPRKIQGGQHALSPGPVILSLGADKNNVKVLGQVYLAHKKMPPP